MLPTVSNKLLAQWKGSYNIVRRIDYEILTSKRRKKIFHVNMLKKWYEATNDTSYFCEELDMVEESEEEDLADGWNKFHLQSLEESQQRSLQQLLSQFEGVLSGKPGRTSITEHTIKTKIGNPIRQTPYRIPYVYRAAVEK